LLGKIIKKVRKSLSKGEVKQAQKDAMPTSSESSDKSTAPKPSKPRPQGTRRPAKPSSPQRQQSGKGRSSGEKPASMPPKEQAKSVPKIKWDLAQFDVPPVEGKTRFHDLDLPIEIMHGIFDLGFEYCTPIQAAILPQALTGADASGRAQTGTGKSAAFLITILTRLQRNPIQENRRPGTPRALIIVPTRELALQVKKDASFLGKYTRSKVVAVFGGMDYQKQKQMLAEKVVDIVVATPGRLLDFKRQGDLHLSKVEIMVIDEADRMLDMGFIPDVRQIINSTPPRAKRQTMLFGATLTPEVTRLSSQWTREPVQVDIEPEQVVVDTVDQIVYLTTSRERFALLYNTITQKNLKRVIVFCNRRDQTRRLSERLRAHGINCAMLSGEIAQKKRIKTLEDFRSGLIRVMVATDVAGRGIHIEGISHVVNYNLPLDPEDYVHRIGRTGRAGATGTSISFATEDEAFQLPKIEEYLGNKLNCTYPEDQLLTPPQKPLKETPQQPASRTPNLRGHRPNNRRKPASQRN